MSGSVAISSFLRHEVSFWVCGSAILILSAIVLVNGRALSAKPYPTPECIPLGITASAILILRRGSIRQWLSAFGISLHWRLTSPETIVPEAFVTGEYRAYRLGGATNLECPVRVMGSV